LLAWQAAGLHCSANERRADEASRDVEAWLKCKYMREHLGEEFTGLVTAVTSFGLFVTLESLYVEGLVHITELGGEYFRHDEARQELRGERTGIRYALGTRVRVQVSRVDLDGRRIDFRLVVDEDNLVARALREKAGESAVKPGGRSSAAARESGASSRGARAGAGRAARSQEWSAGGSSAAVGRAAKNGQKSGKPPGKSRKGKR
jgi:ribonuclease R